MSLVEVYNQYPSREFTRKVEIKRKLATGGYENDWQDVVALSGLPLLDKTVGSISFKLPSDGYNFGLVTVGNLKLKLNSKQGQFDDEGNANSVFYPNYQRHETLVRINDGYIDRKTGQEFTKQVFFGFIDGISRSTKVDNDNINQNLQCIDALSFLLKKYTKADMGNLVSTSLDDLIFEIMNRSEFTDFLTIDSSNIQAGYDIQNIDLSQYEGQTQLLTIFQDLSKGHSFFFLDEQEFYYRKVNLPIQRGIENDTILDEAGNILLDEAGDSILSEENIYKAFDVKKDKVIKFTNYDEGLSQVFEKIYWADNETVSFISPTNQYNKSKTIDIKGVVDNTQRQNIVNIVGSITSLARKKVMIEIPYFQDINIFDELTVEEPIFLLNDAFIWDISKFDDGKRLDGFFRADNINLNQTWLVIEINHSNFKTKIKLQEIR
jgi:hypothetical protein